MEKAFLKGIFFAAASSLDGLNRYTYCKNNPVRYTDPTGNITEEGARTLTEYLINNAPYSESVNGAFNEYNQYRVYMLLNGLMNGANSTTNTQNMLQQNKSWWDNFCDWWNKGPEDLKEFKIKLASMDAKSNTELELAQKGIKPTAPNYEKEFNLLYISNFDIAQDSLELAFNFMMGGIGGGASNKIVSLFQKYPIGTLKCDKLANELYSIFKSQGSNPEILKITDQFAARYFFDANGSIFAESGFHQAVKIEGKVFDALTGPNGMAYTEYIGMLKKLGIAPVINTIK